MRMLGIESSCDESALALLTKSGEDIVVEWSKVLSQVKIHAEYGGVVPEVAARKHLEALTMLVREELDPNTFDAIAVTAGPGLAPALRTGVEVAKTLAWSLNKPLYPMSHLEGHVYAAWLDEESSSPAFPALCLLVSGGHTELILMRGHGDYERIGETLDDAAGEAFDKVAKMLGLGYPGGPEVAKLAEGGDVTAFDFPRGLLDRPDLNFSFSGLKTSVLYTLRDQDHLLEQEEFRRNIAASFQEAVVDVLVRKTMRAIKKHEPKSVILAGGVAANIELRERLLKAVTDIGLTMHLPPFAYSLDNAAMIAAAGLFRAEYDQPIDPLALKANPNTELVYART